MLISEDLFSKLNWLENEFSIFRNLTSTIDLVRRSIKGRPLGEVSYRKESLRQFSLLGTEISIRSNCPLRRTIQKVMFRFSETH